MKRPRPMTKLDIDYSIPEYLEHDINALIEGTNAEECSYLDCLQMEVYGSINMACISERAITMTQADELRDYYFFRRTS